MHFNILTVFPEMFPGTLSGGVVGRALDKKIWSMDVINIRDFAINNYDGAERHFLQRQLSTTLVLKSMATLR